MANNHNFKVKNGLDVTGNITVGGTVDGRDLVADGNKLDGVSTGAEANPSASEMLTAIKTVDGSGSGLDADLLDGLNSDAFVSVTGDTMSGVLAFSQNPVGTTYGGTSSSTPSVMISQTVGDNDGWRLYGEAPSTNDVKMIFEVVDDLETGDTWIFRNKKTYSPYSSTEDFKITGAGEIYARGNGYVNSNQRIFADNYHPNADKWTTARTLSLSGDASGSVSWDGSGNATLSVTVADNSHNHDYVPERNRTDWNDSTVISDVIGQLAWKNYGNNHTIFDASASTSPDGTSIGNTDPVVAWVATYPTLMGWNGTNTYGVRVDSSRYADRWKTARTLSLSGDASGSVSWDGSANATLSVTVADDSHNHDGRYYTESEADGRFTSSDHFKWRGTNYLTSTTTSALKTELLNRDVFDSHVSAFKTGWSYSGNGDLTDAGRLGELAGTSWLTWTDNSADNTQGNFTALVIAPNTGGSAGKMFVYNDQGSGYAPGWREIWTSSSDGSGSGLDADTLDGYHASSFRVNSYDTDAYADSVYVDNWFRARYDTGLYFEDKGRGLRDVASEGGQYGSVATYAGLNGWEGWSIGGRVVFMHNMSNDWGIYNDVNNEWLIYGLLNNYVELRYDNNTRFRTNLYGNVFFGYEANMSDNVIRVRYGSSYVSTTSFGFSGVNSNYGNFVTCNLTGNSSIDCGLSNGMFYIVNILPTSYTMTWNNVSSWLNNGGSPPALSSSEHTLVAIMNFRGDGNNWRNYAVVIKGN
jgi:hypothetical protein